MDEEDLLLDSGTSIDIGNLSDLNEAAILDDDNDNGGEGAKESSPVHCEVEDLEELDYDEDIEEEKAPRSGKFTSERALIRKESLTSNEPRGVNISSTDSVTKGTISHTSTEPENKSLEPKSISRTAIPSSPQNLSVAKPQAAKAKSSLLSSIAKNTQPSNAPKANRQQQSARTPAKMLINPHYKGILQPKNKLLANWNPPVAPRPGLASSLSVLPIPSSMPCSMPVPMQASGVSCIGLPTLPAITRPVPYDMNISSSILFPRPASSLPPLMSFNAPPPASMYHYSAPPPVAPAISSNGQWDKMVEGFLRRTSAHNRSPRRYSSASKSSSSSSRSSSRSYYSGSSFTSNSSRSSSISPHRSERRYRRERRHSSSPRHVDEKRPRNGRGGRVRYGDEHTDIEHFRTSQRPRASEVLFPSIS
ncbi:hypothetical protein AB6A40_010149 [Gnathostoma spinigerum]|uniref:Uncharacterized protein n=1 Tax=Gnathostoma spinigerum TaxID=75299 RepID=A0ABD6EVA9_9BILA